MPPFDESNARVAQDAEHALRAVRAIRGALANVPFYVKQGLAAPDEAAELESALAALPLLTPAKIRPTLPKSWLPEGRDAKAELASGKLAVVETGLAESRIRLLWDGAWWRAQEARALGASPKAAAALGASHSYRDAVLWVPERGTGSCGSGTNHTAPPGPNCDTRRKRSSSGGCRAATARSRAIAAVSSAWAKGASTVMCGGNRRSIDSVGWSGA